jgi:hypothetical protein
VNTEPKVILTDGKNTVTLTVNDLRPETIIMLITDALDLCDKITDAKTEAQKIMEKL